MLFRSFSPPDGQGTGQAEGQEIRKGRSEEEGRIPEKELY